MDYISLQWTPYTPIVLASFVICSTLAVVAWRRRGHPTVPPFVVMMVGCALYAGTTALEYSVVGLEPTLFWWRVQYLGWALVPPAVLVFVLRYTGRASRVTPRLLALVAIVPAISLALAFTPLAPEFLLRNPQMVEMGAASYLTYDHGVWYVIDGLYGSFLVALAFVLLVENYLQVTPGQRSQVGLLVVGLLPYVTLVPIYYYALPLVVGWEATIEIEPSLYAATGVAFAWALFTHPFLDGIRVPFDALLETTPNGILVVDTDSRVVECNRTARTYLGLGEPVIGRRLATLSEPAERAAAIIDDGEESELRVGDDVYRISVESLAGSDGVEYGRMIVVRDVTERVRYERALTRHNEQLETLNQMLRHDIRNDTMIALGWGDVLRETVEDTPLESETTPLLDRIDDSVRHVVDLTEIAADLSRPLESPSEELGRSISLDRILAREVEKAAESFPDAEFTLRDPPAVQVGADRALASAVSNVLRNAVVHSDREVPTIDVRVEVVDGTALVHIEDDGPGIPDDERERVFERGVTGERSDGSGLGLHLVRTFVDWYDGTVAIEDNEPRGTRLTIGLPIVE